NLKTLINDISIYTLKNDHLNSIKTMSNVSGIENIDLSNFNGTKEVNFRVGDDKKCLKLVFINKVDFILMGISSNEASKNAIINAANQSHEDLENVNFTSSSSNKACVILSKNENFKNLASKTYLLIGGM
ncbi:prepilin-type cleavage/methylation domain-containing protein, partial [Campylobacter jejuni]